MSFSGIPNSYYCGGLLAFVMMAAVLSRYWPLLCKVRRRALYFILKNCFTINKKYLKHAKLALQRANNPVVNETNCSETLDNQHAVFNTRFAGANCNPYVSITKS